MVPTKAHEAADADPAFAGPLRRERRENLFLVTRSAESRNRHPTSLLDSRVLEIL